MTIQVGDWVRWKYGIGYGETISVVTKVEETCVIVNFDTVVQYSNILEVRSPKEGA